MVALDHFATTLELSAFQHVLQRLELLLQIRTAFAIDVGGRAHSLR